MKSNIIKNRSGKLYGADLIFNERQEQFSKHGKTIEADIENNKNGELERGAAAILLLDVLGEEAFWDFYPINWSQDFADHLLHNKTPLERKIIAGALVSAAIDSMQFCNEYFEEISKKKAEDTSANTPAPVDPTVIQNPVQDGKGTDTLVNTGTPSGYNQYSQQWVYEGETNPSPKQLIEEKEKIQQNVEGKLNEYIRRKIEGTLDDLPY